MDISDNLLGAVDLLLQKAITELNFDKTIQAEITERLDDGYKCASDNIVFTAYPTNTDIRYSVGDKVQILIPQGNMKDRLTIVSKIENIKDTDKYNPFRHFVNQQLIFSEKNSKSLKANEKTQPYNSTFVNIFENRSISEYFNNHVLYDTIGIKFAINTSILGQYHDVLKNSEYKSTYGIRIKIGNNHEYIYDTSQMFGNLYNGDGDIYHEVLFDIDNIQDSNITLQFFQNGDFIEKTEDGTLSWFLGGENSIIAIKDIQVFLGNDASKHPESNAFIAKLMSADNLYYYSWNNNENSKEILYTILNQTREIPANYKTLVKLQYKISSDKEWKEWEYYNDDVIIPPQKLLREDKITFRYALELLTGEMIYSNEIECEKWRIIDPRIAAEYKTAIRLEYMYTQGIDLTKPFSLNQKTASTSIGTYQDTTDTGIQYVGFENILKNQVEAFSPHYINMFWEPQDELLKGDFLAGATISWKVPCPYSFEPERFDIKDADGNITSDTVNFNRLRDIFNQQLLTVLMPIKYNREFYIDRDNNAYAPYNSLEFVKDESGLYYAIISHTFGNNFVQNSTSHALQTRSLNYSPLHDGLETDRDIIDRQYLSQHFLVKEQYLKTMKNNKITCQIQKDNHIFTQTIDLKITANTNSKVSKMIVIQDNFEPIYSLVTKDYKQGETYPSGATGYNTIHNLKVLLEDFDNNGNIVEVAPGDLDIDIVRPLVEPSVIYPGLSLEEKTYDYNYSPGFIISKNIYNGTDTVYGYNCICFKIQHQEGLTYGLALNNLSLKFQHKKRKVSMIKAFPKIIRIQEIDKNNRTYCFLYSMITGNQKIIVDKSNKIVSSGTDLDNRLIVQLAAMPYNVSNNINIYEDGATDIHIRNIWSNVSYYGDGGASSEAEKAETIFDAIDPRINCGNGIILSEQYLTGTGVTLVYNGSDLQAKFAKLPYISYGAMQPLATNATSEEENVYYGIYLLANDTLGLDEDLYTVDTSPAPHAFLYLETRVEPYKKDDNHYNQATIPVVVTRYNDYYSDFNENTLPAGILSANYAIGDTETTNRRSAEASLSAIVMGKVQIDDTVREGIFGYNLGEARFRFQTNGEILIGHPAGDHIYLSEGGQLEISLNGERLIKTWKPVYGSSSPQEGEPPIGYVYTY